MLDKIHRFPAVEDMIGKSRSQIYRDVAAGRFPPPVRLGPNSVGWRESDLRKWLREREDAGWMRNELITADQQAQGSI